MTVELFDKQDPKLDRVIRVAQARCPDGVLVVDGRGRIASYNRRFVQLWGIPRRVLAGRSDREAIRFVLDKLVDPQGFRARVQYLYRNRRERSREEIALKDGRTIERHSAPIVSTAGEYFGRVWYFRDISERRKAEQRARDSERLRLQHEFIASVSHDLHTPLTAIEGFTETLLNGALDDTRNRKRFLRTIIGQSRRLRRLVDGLLDHSHFEAAHANGRAETAPFDLCRCLRDLVCGMRPVFRRKRARLKLSARGQLRVEIDETHLARIVGNLLDNAVKYGPVGGVVRVAARREGRRAVLTVQDRGIGISREDLPRIFERFHRSEAARRRGIPGHGLGLPQIKQLIERAGGRISVESREGRGSTFRVELPLARCPSTLRP